MKAASQSRICRHIRPTYGDGDRRKGKETRRNAHQSEIRNIVNLTARNGGYFSIFYHLFIFVKISLKRFNILGRYLFKDILS